MARADHGETGSVAMDDGCRIAYRLDGDPTAPVLLLSNSLGTNMEMWAPQMALFSARRRVLRYDSRGHGASDAPLGGYSMGRLGRDAIGLLDAIGVERVDFCGLSMGGMVGQWLGHRAPQRLRRLILANTSAYMGPPSGWQSRIDKVMKEGVASIADAVIERWVTPEFVAGHADIVAAVRDQLLATSARGYAGCCAAIRDMDMRPVGRLIDVVTLVIGGTRDPATPPSHAEHLARSIPGARLAILDAAHLSNVERPSMFGRAVSRFLEDLA